MKKNSEKWLFTRLKLQFHRLEKKNDDEKGADNVKLLNMKYQ